MDLEYSDETEAVAVDADRSWRDDPAIAAYLERSQQAERERIDEELARIDEQLAARETLHDEFMAELEWQVETYERELNRLTTPFASKTEEREHVQEQLRALRRQMREECRQHWQDRQRLEQERRELLHERVALDEDTVAELIY